MGLFLGGGEKWSSPGGQKTVHDGLIQNVPFSPNRSVIDVGCGRGKLFPEVPFGTYVGVDSSEQMIKVAQNEYPLGHFFVQDVMEIQDSYDIVLASSLFSQTWIRHDSLIDHLWNICNVFLSFSYSLIASPDIEETHVLREYCLAKTEKVGIFAPGGSREWIVQMEKSAPQ